MFAFALYDSTNKHYLLGRDHIGIIPMYTGYDEHGNFMLPLNESAGTGLLKRLKNSPPVAICPAMTIKSIATISVTDGI